MAKRKPPSGQALKQGRSKLAQLKKLGLWSGDARKAKLGWRQKALIKEFSDVLAGKAKVVTAKGKAARNIPLHSSENKGAVRRKGSRLIVPVRSKDERPRFNPKTGEVQSHVYLYGGKYKRILFTKKMERVQDLPDPPEGRTYHYGLTSVYNRGMLFEDKSELANFLAQYKRSEKSLIPYLEVLEPVKMGDREGTFDE